MHRVRGSAVVLGFLGPALLLSSAWADPPPRPTLSLDQAFEQAKTRSPELNGLGERVLEAEANVSKAWAFLKPQWSASYNWTHLEPAPPVLEFPEPLNLSAPGIQTSCQQGADPIPCLGALVDEFNRARDAPPRRLDFANQNTHTLSTRVTWTILDGRALPLLFDAQDNVALEAHRTTAKSRELLLLVAKAYYSAAATQGAIAVAERALGRAQAQAQIAQARAEVGDKAQPLLQAVQAAVRQAALDVERAKNAHEQSLLALGLLLGTDERADVLPPPVLERPAGDLALLVKESTARRPDLAAAQAALAIADRSQNDFWWSFVPTLSLFAGWRYSNVQGLTGQNDQWSFALNANLPLYDGGARYADQKLNDSRLRTARLAVQSLEQRLRNDLERAVLRLQAADLGKARAQETIALAERNLSVVQAERDVGAVRPLDLQEAADAVLDSELGLIRAEVEIAIGTLDLQHAAGLFDP